MANVIDHPKSKVQPDSLPVPGDRYQAYGLAHAAKPLTVHFVQPDGSMTGFPYTRLGMLSFAPAAAWENDGECVISVVFDNMRGGTGSLVIVTGRDLFRFFDYLGSHLAGWLWAASDSQADDGGPRVHAIEIKEATPDAMRALLDRRPRGEADETEPK